MSAASNARHIRLELEPEADVVHGVVEHTDGRREPFWGWLELMAALERVASGSQSDPSNDVRR